MKVLKTLLLLALLLLPEFSLLAQKGKIAVFGSSVANGSGDTTGGGGYAGMLKALLEPRGWQVVNVSKGGDNTTKILPRFESQLLPEKPDIVIIGLSLGNEGISNPSELARARVFEKYRSGMQHLIRLCRENNMMPVVVNCYARSDFGPEQYDAVKKMNLIINSWDVASVNVMGTIDNGKGQWVEGFLHDRSHPDIDGHREMFHAFVPGLFDAIRSGKKIPEKNRGAGYLEADKVERNFRLVYRPEDSIHSFAVSFQVKCNGDGILGSADGKDFSFSIRRSAGRIGMYRDEKLIAGGDTSNESKGWQYVVISYNHALKTTTFFLNGRYAGAQQADFSFRQFMLGGSAVAANLPPADSACYRELMIYRSGLNPDEVTALYHDQLLQSSLEVYAPLNDPAFIPGEPVMNQAQSMSKLVVTLAGSGGL
jgi:lysophospholipase L1-like esterase